MRTTFATANPGRVMPAVFMGLVGLVALGGCNPLAPMDPAPRVDVDRGAQLFASNCAACHGADGTGGGAASLGLGIVPPDLTNLAARNGGVLPTNEVRSAIDGFYREDHFNPMPAFGEQDLGPLVQVEEAGLSTPIPADLLALSNYLASIQTE